MGERSSNENELIRRLNTRVDLLEQMIKEESSPEKLRSILDEVYSLVGDNSEMFEIYKAARLMQQSNLCSNLSLERQSVLLDLISKLRSCDSPQISDKPLKQDSNTTLIKSKSLKKLFLLLKEFKIRLYSKQERFYENWSYADIIRTISLVVSSIGIIINLVFNLLQIHRNNSNKS